MTFGYDPQDKLRVFDKVTQSFVLIDYFASPFVFFLDCLRRKRLPYSALVAKVNEIVKENDIDVAKVDLFCISCVFM